MTARHWHAHSRNSYTVGYIMAGAAARLRIYFWPLAPRVGAGRINHKIYNSRPPEKKGKKKISQRKIGRLETGERVYAREQRGGGQREKNACPL